MMAGEMRFVDTKLFEAVIKDNRWSARFWLFLGANANAKDNNGNTALMRASSQGNFDCVKLLLPVSDVKTKNNNGNTALMLASINGHVECANLLLPVSDVRAESNIGWTALMHASYYGKFHCVKLLLPVSDVNAKDSDGWTALMWASVNGHLDCANAIESYLAEQEAKEIEAEITQTNDRHISSRRI